MSRPTNLDPVQTLETMRAHLQEGSAPSLTIRGGDYSDMTGLPYYCVVMTAVKETARFQDSADIAHERLAAMGGFATEASVRVGDHDWLDKQRARLMTSQHTVARLLRQAFSTEPQLVDIGAWDNDSMEVLGFESLTQAIEVESLLDMPPRSIHPAHPGVFFSPAEIHLLLQRAADLGISTNRVRAMTHKFRHSKSQLELDLRTREVVARHKYASEQQRQKTRLRRSKQ